MSESTYYIRHCCRFCLILSNNYAAFLLLSSRNLNQIIHPILHKSWFFSFINLKKILLFYRMNKKRPSIFGQFDNSGHSDNCRQEISLKFVEFIFPELPIINLKCWNYFSFPLVCFVCLASNGCANAKKWAFWNWHYNVYIVI